LPQIAKGDLGEFLPVDSSQLTHTTIATNGINLHVVQAGDPAAPLVILLHGFPEFWYGWRHQIAPLAGAGFHLWVPDQRGYNLSDKPQDVAAYNLDVLAQDVIGLIDAAGREKTLLVGHDWGGAVAWWTANKYPQRVEKLAILNAPHHRVFAEQVRRVRSQQLRSSYMLYLQLKGLSEASLRMFNHWLLAKAMQVTSAGGTFSAVDLQEYRRAWSQPGAITGMLNWYRAMRQKPRPERPASWRIPVPTLLIWGKQDSLLRWQMAQPSIDLCDDGRLVFIDRASHWIAAEAAEEVNQLLIEFLGR
jgi:pimeloyl-ACP methyl ester carboxylesterase